MSVKITRSKSMSRHTPMSSAFRLEDGLDENYRDLACAICERAVEDYEKAYRKLLKLKAHPERTRDWRYMVNLWGGQVKTLEKFFRGAQFALYSDSIDGEATIEAIRRRCEEDE